MILDALVIGGGPSGATTALMLAKAGWSVTIVEKKIFPRRKVCGEFISATSFPLLQKFNLDHFYLTNSGPEVKRVGLFADDCILTSEMPGAYDSKNHWGRAIGREHLDTILLDMASQAGVQRLQPMNVKTIKRRNNLFICSIESNNDIREISARIVIMANGSWEKSPEQIEIPPHKPSDLLAFKSHFTNSELAPDLMGLLAFPGGYGGIVNTDEGRMTISCCIRRDMLQNIRSEYSGLQAGEAILKHINKYCHGTRPIFASAIREGNWLAAGPIRPGIRECYANGIFFVGNSAGEAHPIIADGISMAMQSAWILSTILIEQHGIKNISEIGYIYTKKWRSHFRNRIYTAACFAHWAMRPWLVNMTLPIVKLFPSILTFGAELSGKINQIVPITISKE